MPRLDAVARERFHKGVLHLAVRWVLDHGSRIALWGGRRPDQMDPVPEIMGWRLDQETLDAIDAILAETIKASVGPEFMAPPPRRPSNTKLRSIEGIQVLVGATRWVALF